jgi:hypothetical protein
MAYAACAYAQTCKQAEQATQGCSRAPHPVGKDGVDKAHKEGVVQQVGLELAALSNSTSASRNEGKGGGGRVRKAKSRALEMKSMVVVVKEVQH